MKNLREIVNGSFEPLWRKHAREDSEKFKSELLNAPTSRRKFMVGAGSAAVALAEYIEQRRAIGMPLRPGPVALAPSSVTGITNERTGTTYPYLQDAFNAMLTGDTILLPAGLTYQYGGGTRYYSDILNMGSNFRLGPFQAVVNPTSTMTAEGGSIEAVGTANNGRALIAPPWGILASSWNPATDTEIFLDPSTPCSNFLGYPYLSGRVLPRTVGYGNVTFSYTGINVPNNSLTGVTGGVYLWTGGTLPPGTILVTLMVSSQGVLCPAGQQPWIFRHLELAYNHGDTTAVPIWCVPSLAAGPYIGSVKCYDCFLHDCEQGMGLNYAPINNGITFEVYDSEIYSNGFRANGNGQVHNTYIGHSDQYIMDNSYCHLTQGAWNFKSRASLNILTYNQIRAEGDDYPTATDRNGGMDFSNGGLCYMIGNVITHAATGVNALIDWNAEADNTGNVQCGQNPLQEIYLINNTLKVPDTGSSGGTNWGIVKNYWWHPRCPPVTRFDASVASGSARVTRGYGVSYSGVNGGGETAASRLSGNIGYNALGNFINVGTIPANKILSLPSPPQCTGQTGYNVYMNYADPTMYAPPLSGPFVIQDALQAGNTFFWDAGLTQPVFSTTSGATLISCTATLASGNYVATSVTALSGVGCIAQLLNMGVWISGTNSKMYVRSVDTISNTITLYSTYGAAQTTTGTVTLTFGHFLYGNITYQTAIGDSLRASQFGDFAYWTWGLWTDAFWNNRSDPYVYVCAVQVPPGQKLVVNAPPSGPAYATGVNVWLQSAPPDIIDGSAYPAYWGSILSLSKQNSTPITFGGTWTSDAAVYHQEGTVGLIQYKQNASPISFGTGFAEATTELVNHNPLSNATLKWKKRDSVRDLPVDEWYAVVPGGGLTNYVETIYVEQDFSILTGTLISGTVSIWRGCATSPFSDANFFRPAVGVTQSEVTVSSAGGNVTLIAASWTNVNVGGGAIAPGWTQVSIGGGYVFTQYMSSATALSNIAAYSSAGLLGPVATSWSPIIVDALVGTSAPPTFVSKVDFTGAGSARTVQFTIPSANAGDVLVLTVSQSRNAGIVGVGAIEQPVTNTMADGLSPVIVIKNCLSANVNNVGALGGGWASNGDGPYALPPSANVTVTTSLLANPNTSVDPYSGSTHGSPSWATVFNDAVQADYDFRLAVSSPAKNAASDPGTSPYGQDLVPHYQTSWHGTPTPGASPIPAKAARTDIGPTLTGSIGALT